MNKVYLLVSIFFVIAIKSFAQSKGTTPMHTFFQKYGDSTLILEYNTQGYDPNYYFILTKTGDTINSFRYLAKMKLEQGLMPKDMKVIISMEKYKNSDAPATINSYFNVVNLNQDTLKLIWAKADSSNVWKIKEDNTIPICADGIKIPTVLHCGYLMMHVITKEKIKTLAFACPWVYEEYCSGNYNRKGAIEVDALFRKYFPDTYH